MKKLERKMFGDICCWFKTFVVLTVLTLITAIAVFPFFICRILTKVDNWYLSVCVCVLFRQFDNYAQQRI